MDICSRGTKWKSISDSRKRVLAFFLKTNELQKLGIGSWSMDALWNRDVLISLNLENRNAEENDFS